MVSSAIANHPQGYKIKARKDNHVSFSIPAENQICFNIHCATLAEHTLTHNGLGNTMAVCRQRSYVDEAGSIAYSQRPLREDYWLRKETCLNYWTY